MADTIINPTGPAPAGDDTAWRKLAIETAIRSALADAGGRLGITIDTKKLGVEGQAALARSLSFFEYEIGGAAKGAKLGVGQVMTASRDLADAIVRDVAATVAGTAPTPTTATKGILDAKKKYVAAVAGQAGVYKVAASAAGHQLETLLTRLGVKQFGPAVARVIEDGKNNPKLQDISANWEIWAKNIGAALLQDKNMPVLAELLKVSPAATATVTPPPRTPTPVTPGDGRDPARPPAPASSASSAKPRPTAGTNALAHLIAQMKSGTEGKVAEQVIKLGAEEILKQSGASVDKPAARAKIDAAAADAAAALAPILRKAQGKDRLEQLEIIANGLVDKAKAGRGADGTGALGRYKRLAEIAKSLRSDLERKGLLSHALTQPGQERLDRMIGFALTSFIGDAVGVRLDPTNVDETFLRFTALTEALLDKGGLDAMLRKQIKQAAPAPLHPLVKVVSLPSGEKQVDGPASARAFADALIARQPAVAPRRDEIIASYEAVFAKNPKDNLGICLATVSVLADIVGDTDFPRLDPVLKEVAKAEAAHKAAASDLGRIEGVERSAQGELAAQRAFHGDAKLAAAALAATPGPALDAALAEVERIGGEITALEALLQKATTEIATARDVLATVEANIVKLTGSQMDFLAAGTINKEKFLKDCDVQAAAQAAGGGGGPNAPANGGGGASGSGGAGGAQGADSERLASLARRRADECALILNDPSLSIQDKIFLFMMTYASYSDMEREEKLRELVEADKTKADQDVRRSRNQADKAAADGVVNDRKDEKAAADDVVKNVAALPADDPKKVAALATQAAANVALKDATAAVDEVMKKGAKEERDFGVSKSRDVLFMEMERISKWRDQIIQMARSMLDESNRLVERIFR